MQFCRERRHLPSQNWVLLSGHSNVQLVPCITEAVGPGAFRAHAVITFLEPLVPMHGKPCLEGCSAEPSPLCYLVSICKICCQGWGLEESTNHPSWIQNPGKERKYSAIQISNIKEKIEKGIHILNEGKISSRAIVSLRRERKKKKHKGS